MKENFKTEIAMNKWNLEDLLINKQDHNKRLAQISTVASMVTDDSDIDQLRAVLSLIQTTLYDIRTVSENDAELLEKQIKEAQILTT